MLDHLDPAKAELERRARRRAITRAALVFFAVTASLYALAGLARVVWGDMPWRAAANWNLARLVPMAVVAPLWAWFMWHGGYVRARPTTASSDSHAGS